MVGFKVLRIIMCVRLVPVYVEISRTSYFIPSDLSTTLGANPEVAVN